MSNEANQLRCRNCGAQTSEADGAQIVRGERILGVRAYCPQCHPF